MGVEYIKMEGFDTGKVCVNYLILFIYQLKLLGIWSKLL